MVYGDDTIEKKQSPLTTTFQTIPIKNGGIARKYLLFTPPGQRCGVKLPPSVVMLHGRYGTAEQFVNDRSDLVRVAKRKKFTLVFASGVNQDWNSGASYPGSPKTDETAYFKALFTDLKSRCVTDPNRIYGIGFSNGGVMLQHLANDNIEHFKAIATVSSYLPEPMYPAKTLKPVPILMTRSVGDNVVPYLGGPVGWPHKIRGSAKSTDWVFKYWQRVNQGETFNSKIVFQSNGLHIQTVANGKAPVLLYTAFNLRHRWPEANDGLDTTNEILKFFSI
jgi:polyhydroxybutyrate depolymerase